MLLVQTSERKPRFHFQKWIFGEYILKTLPMRLALTSIRSELFSTLVTQLAHSLDYLNQAVDWDEESQAGPSESSSPWNLCLLTTSALPPPVICIHLSRCRNGLWLLLCQGVRAFWGQGGPPAKQQGRRVIW